MSRPEGRNWNVQVSDELLTQCSEWSKYAVQFRFTPHDDGVTASLWFRTPDALDVCSIGVARISTAP